MGSNHQLLVNAVLMPTTVFAALLAVQGASTSDLIPSLDVSFQLAVQGLGAATFYTLQQQLPHPTLPYAVHDEWVQFAYPDGTAAIYNVARVSPAAVDDTVHDDLLPSANHFQRECATGDDICGSCHEGKSAQPSCPRVLRRSSMSQPSRVQDYVAVRASDAPGYLAWFQRHASGLVQHSSTAASEPAQAPLPQHAGDGPAPAAYSPRRNSGCTIESDRDSHATHPNPQFVAAQDKYAQPMLAQQTRTDQPSLQVPSGSDSQSLDQRIAVTCKHRNFMLYFGMSIPLSAGGGAVSQQEMQTFLAVEVSPRVQGFTVMKASGFWQGEVEQTVVLEVISDTTDIGVAVQEIAEAYKRQFRQHAVLVKEQACPVVNLV